MPIRPITFPQDFDTLVEITPRMFQYPENSAWSVQQDESDELVEQTRSLKRIWPLVRLAMRVSPVLRDAILGFVWEEDGRPVGTIMVQRRGATDKWLISNVGVLPEYRRRGIARRLVEAGNALIRERGGTHAVLDVIDGNLPAIALYRELGYEHYSGNIDLDLTPGSVPDEPPVPQGCTCIDLAPLDWRPRYEMDLRTHPESLTRYEPVEIGRYRPPAVMWLLNPIMRRAQNVHSRDICLRGADGLLLGRAGYTVPKRSVGLSSIYARLDPAHPELAEFLVRFSLHHAAALGGSKRIEASAATWQKEIIAALEAHGFVRRREFLRMGLTLA